MNRRQFTVSSLALAMTSQGCRNNAKPTAPTPTAAKANHNTTPMNSFKRLTEVEHEAAVKGFDVFDCAIRSREVFSFLLIAHSDTEGHPRMFNFSVNEVDDERIVWTDYEDFRSQFDTPLLAASQLPKNQAVMVTDFKVAALGGGDNGIETPIPHGKPTTPLDTSCHNLATIDGMIYAVGGWRAVCKRLGPNHWESLAGDRSTLLTPRSKNGSTNAGFNAISGFNANDIYCVGDGADAWHFDGKRWTQCAVFNGIVSNGLRNDLPSFESVCCAGDGYVYIAMYGSVIRGRGDKWTIIYKDRDVRIKSMVWFDGKVWCISEYGARLRVIEDGKLSDAPVPAKVVTACSGSLAVGDGVMLLAGMGATVYDGKQWHELW